jgi:hypothetical protein
VATPDPQRNAQRLYNLKRVDNEKRAQDEIRDLARDGKLVPAILQDKAAVVDTRFEGDRVIAIFAVWHETTGTVVYAEYPGHQALLADRDTLSHNPLEALLLGRPKSLAEREVRGRALLEVMPDISLNSFQSAVGGNARTTREMYNRLTDEVRRRKRS